MLTELKNPFTEGQLELLKLFNTPFEEKELQELREILLDFKFRKLQQMIDKDVAQKGYTTADFDKMQLEHNRTVYQSNRKTQK